MLGLFKKKFDLEKLVAGSVEGLQIATAAHSNTWHLGEEESWDIDQDDGLIVFTFSDGTVAKAPVQIIGTFNSSDETFMWGWDHPSVKPELQEAAIQVKAFGKKHDLKELYNQNISCNEQRAWEYAALAMRITEANCAYRAEASPGTYVFMTFGKVQLVKKHNKS